MVMAPTLRSRTLKVALDAAAAMSTFSVPATPVPIEQPMPTKSCASLGATLAAPVAVTTTVRSAPTAGWSPESSRVTVKFTQSPAVFVAGKSLRLSFASAPATMFNDTLARPDTPTDGVACTVTMPNAAGSGLNQNDPTPMPTTVTVFMVPPVHVALAKKVPVDSTAVACRMCPQDEGDAS